MDRDEFLQYLTDEADLLQIMTVELQEQHDEIEKQLKSYKQLVRMYRGVYESEAGVGILNRLPAEIMEILEKKFADEEAPSRERAKRKIKKRKKR